MQLHPNMRVQMVNVLHEPIQVEDTVRWAVWLPINHNAGVLYARYAPELYSTQAPGTLPCTSDLTTLT